MFGWNESGKMAAYGTIELRDDNKVTVYYYRSESYVRDGDWAWEEDGTTLKYRTSNAKDYRYLPNFSTYGRSSEVANGAIQGYLVYQKR